jgi:hypothetical protein
MSSEPQTEEDRAFLSRLKDVFLDLVDGERQSMKTGAAPRRFVCINAIHNHAEGLTNNFLSTARTPFSSRIRQGFVIPEEVLRRANTNMDWTREMHPASAGVATNAGIMTTSEAGHVMYGPYRLLPSGHYRASVLVTADSSQPTTLFARADESAVLEVVIGEKVFNRKSFTRRNLKIGLLEIDFEITRKELAEQLQLILWVNGKVDFTVTKVYVSPVDDSAARQA